MLNKNQLFIRHVYKVMIERVSVLSEMSEKRLVQRVASAVTLSKFNADPSLRYRPQPFKRQSRPPGVPAGQENLPKNQETFNSTVKNIFECSKKDLGSSQQGYSWCLALALHIVILTAPASPASFSRPVAMLMN